MNIGEKSYLEQVRPEIETWLKEVGRLSWSSYNSTLYENWFSWNLKPKATVNYFTKEETEFIGDFAENIEDRNLSASLKGDLEN